MAQLKRTARSRAVPGVGYARRGVIHTVPDDLVGDLLKSGEWEQPGESSGAPAAPAPRTSTDRAGAEVVERVTEPAPAQPAAKAKAKPRAKPKSRKR